MDVIPLKQSQWSVAFAKMPTDMVSLIKNHILLTQPWWCCDQKFQHNDRVLSVHLNGDFLATGSYDGIARIYNTTTDQELISCKHDDWVGSVHLDGGRLATGSYDKIARIFNWHSNYTLEQLELKYALLVWLLIENQIKQLLRLNFSLLM